MGFSYNDITSKSMGLKARLTSWQVSGSLRNFTTTVPGKYGVTDFGADFGYREIVVSCSIFPRHSFPALVSTLDDIADILSVKFFDFIRDHPFIPTVDTFHRYSVING